MTSRLASLLVQDGLVSPKKMAQAFQRQVIYGGTLDTILLEMDAIDEVILVDAMGRASALPTAGDLPSKEQLDGAGVSEWFPLALSERFRAVPVSLDGNVVRVLVIDPPDRKQLDELGYMLSRSIDPIIVPEHRFVHAVEMVYGVTVPARFASLAAKIRQRTSESQRPAPKVVQMEAEPSTPEEQGGERGSERPAPRSPASSAPSVTSSPTAVTRQHSTVAPDVAPDVALAYGSTQPMPVLSQPPPQIQRAVVTDVPMPSPTRALAQAAAPAVELDDARTPRDAPRQPNAPMVPVTHEVTVQSTNASEGQAEALSLSEATRQLDEASERDAIFHALCRGARSQLDFVALLMVHADMAVGRMALGGGWLPREQMNALSLPLDKPSPFRAAVHGKAPYIGRIGEDNVGANALAGLGRKGPLTAVLLPIVLKDRTVALVYGDASGRQVDADLLAGLSTLVAAAGRSFQRLILRQKGADYAKAAPSSPLSKAAKVAAALPAAVAAGGSWKRADDDDLPGKARMTVKGFPALAVTLDEAGNAVPTDIHEQSTRPVPQVVDGEALISSVMREDGDAPSSADTLVSLGERGAQMVVAHLPGPLRLDRHTLRGPAPPLAEHGPLLLVLSRLGRTATQALLTRLEDSSMPLDVRYYATLALGELRTPEVVPALGARLTDPDASVRHTAVQALSQFPMSPELRTLTESLRGELPGPEAYRQRYSSEALGALRDVPSVPRLIELVKHHDTTVVAAARRALIEITKQDFGTSRWRWRSWWDRHRNDSRVEWMLEGLGHAEAEVRMSASEELRTMTDEYFGYHFDLPKREREEARRKWVDWWRTHGAKKLQERPGPLPGGQGGSR